MSSHHFYVPENNFSHQLTQHNIDQLKILLSIYLLQAIYYGSLPDGNILDPAHVPCCQN